MLWAMMTFSIAARTSASILALVVAAIPALCASMVTAAAFRNSAKAP